MGQEGNKEIQGAGVAPSGFFFSTLFNTVPLIFRPLVLINFFWFLWGVNVFVFERFGIDYPTLLFQQTNDSKQTRNRMREQQGMTRNEKQTWNTMELPSDSYLSEKSLSDRLHGRHESQNQPQSVLSQDCRLRQNLTSSEIFSSSMLNFLVLALFYGIYSKLITSEVEEKKDMKGDMLSEAGAVGAKSLFFPFLLYLAFGLILIFPGGECYGSQRKFFMHTLYRVFFPSKPGVSFVEVLLGDILTSVSKVLGDFITVLTLFYLVFSRRLFYFDSFRSNNNEDSFIEQATTKLKTFESDLKHMQAPGHEEIAINDWYDSLLRCWDFYFVVLLIQPLLISLPFLLRFRQCFFQYRIEKASQAKGYNKHLLNCLKYFSSLPVIWLSAYIQFRTYKKQEDLANYLQERPVVAAIADLATEDSASSVWFHLSDNTLRQLWIFAVSFNSFYSFMWDVVMDWGLCQQNSSHVLLRKDLLYKAKNLRQVDALPLSSRLSLVLKFPSFVKLSSMASFNFSSVVSTPRNGQQLDDESQAKVLKHRASDQDLIGNPKENQTLSLNEERFSSSHPASDASLFAQGHEQPSKTLDEGLGFLTGEPVDQSSITSSRQKRSKFWEGLLYYCAIGFDFVFRILWSFKLSVHFQLSHEGQAFLLELCEVFRRFVWIFFRVEWESIVTNQQLAAMSVASDRGDDIHDLGVIELNEATVETKGQPLGNRNHVELQKLGMFRSRSVDLSRTM